MFCFVVEWWSGLGQDMRLRKLLIKGIKREKGVIITNKDVDDDDTFHRANLSYVSKYLRWIHH